MAAEALLLPGENLLLYGKTNAGKTEQLARLIEAMATPERPARVYTAKEPSTLTRLRPLEAKKLVEIERHPASADAFVWIDNAVQGRIFRDGKYVDGTPEKYSLIAFESLSGMAELVLNALGIQAANGFNVGGEPAPGLKIQAEGQVITIPSGSRSHYLVAQKWLLQKIWDTQLLPTPVVMTAHEDVVPLTKKAPDGEKSIEHAAALGISGIIGPLTAGSALTASLPKNIVFTFRLVTVVAESSNKHVMFTGNHKDGSLEGIANARCAVDVKQEPTDVVAMLRTIRGKLK